MPSKASVHGSSPEPTSAAAPTTAHVASGTRQGRMTTPAVASPAIPHVATALCVSIDTLLPGAMSGYCAADGRDAPARFAPLLLRKPVSGSTDDLPLPVSGMAKKNTSSPMVATAASVRNAALYPA